MLELRYKKYGEERKMIYVDWDCIVEKVEDELVEKDSIEIWEDGVKVWSSK